MKKKCLMLNSLSVNLLKNEFNHFENNDTWQYEVPRLELDEEKITCTATA